MVMEACPPSMFDHMNLTSDFTLIPAANEDIGSSLKPAPSIAVKLDVIC